jgi:hypothetical protein
MARNFGTSSDYAACRGSFLGVSSGSREMKIHYVKAMAEVVELALEEKAQKVCCM